MLSILATEANTSTAGWSMVIYLVIIGAMIYFFMMRPQQKEQKKKAAMLSELAVGDTILTTSGFYGTVIDISEEDDTIIVEFGSDRHCRIPMQKAAVSAVEKPEEAVEQQNKK